MAEVYRQYNLRVSVPYHVKFICEKCGKTNSVAHAVSAKSSYSDKGALRQKTINSRREQAVKQLNDNRSLLIRKISDETSRQEYHTIHLTCKCSNCSDRPVWAYPKWFRFAELIKNVSLFFALMIFLFMCLAWIDHESAAWAPFLIAAAPAVLYYFGMFAYSKWQDNQIRKLDPRYLPIIQLAAK